MMRANVERLMAMAAFMMSIPSADVLLQIKRFNRRIGCSVTLQKNFHFSQKES
jgi:hypothetical protein